MNKFKTERSRYEDMGIFFKSAKDRTQHMWSMATVTKRNLRESVFELQQMERLLEQIAKEVPEGAPGSSLRALEHHMELTERASHHSLVNLQRIKEHLKHMEHNIHGKQ